MTDGRDYYCSMKFKYLKIDIPNRSTCNCHAAHSHPIDFNWLEKNPGQLFNTKINVFERQQMLDNQRNKSCEQNCWFAEDRGAVSPRIYQKGQAKTHDKIITQPKIIDIVTVNDCNNTCSYCNKTLSSAWRRDILKNGDYSLPAGDYRYRADTKDKVLNKISQNELKNLSYYKKIMDEIHLLAPTARVITITGGEPFLDNKIVDLLTGLKSNKNCIIKLFTGLGVDKKRLIRILDQIKHIPNLEVNVSAENIGEFLEFNRYGLKWPDFKSKVDSILASGVNMKFNCTISNLTIFGFRSFYETFKQHPIVFNICYDPKMLAPYMLNSTSKEMVSEDISYLPDEYKNKLEQTLRLEPNETDRKNLSQFLKQFVQRRKDLSLKIYPKEFLKWLEIDI